MRFFVYFIVLLITVGSIIFGADWLRAPMTPMPASQYALRAAKPPAVPQVATQAAPAPAAPGSPQDNAAPPTVAAPVTATATPEPPLVAPEPAPVVAAAAPKCDIDACTRAYHSFTASDCTYQPSDGPRRLCTKGTPPAAKAATTAPDARAQATCNIAACSSAYVSFNASDCTYQPVNGPRRVCEK